jgi:dual specificity protein kinase YAK1
LDLQLELQASLTPDELTHFSVIRGHFFWSNRLCIVLDLLWMDLSAVLAKKQFAGVSLAIVQSVARQLFESAKILTNHGIVHSDLKPENLLLEADSSPRIHISDFGHARSFAAPCSSYTQSRYYRSPEVVLGYLHNQAIDIWSIGCILAELFLGLPLFAGQNQIQLLEFHRQFLGPFPPEFIRDAPLRSQFFSESGFLKSEAVYCRERGESVARRFVCFRETRLENVIMKLTRGIGRDARERDLIRQKRELLLDLLWKCFVYVPERRITAEEGLAHPFVTTDLSACA